MLAGFALAEDMKVMASPGGTYKIIVPEKAPDFLKTEWEERLVTEGQYRDGTNWAVVANEKGDMSVRVLIILHEERFPRATILVFSVAYDGDMATDWYFDETFLSDHKPSGVFVGPILPEIARDKLGKLENIFNAARI